ncbi:hypothetical protein DV737_g4200, partial [Chaetothyriales sp. CBS 132003]
MRNPTKAIPATSKEEEEIGNYGRIKAYLSDPVSVKGAVQQSQPSSEPKEIVCLFGLKIFTLDQQWDIIQKVAGKEFKIIQPTNEEYAKFFGAEVPAPIVHYLIDTQEAWLQKDHYP